jgi:hypothetical protein
VLSFTYSSLSKGSKTNSSQKPECSSRGAESAATAAKNGAAWARSAAWKAQTPATRCATRQAMLVRESSAPRNATCWRTLRCSTRHSIPLCASLLRLLEQAGEAESGEGECKDEWPLGKQQGIRTIHSWKGNGIQWPIGPSPYLLLTLISC